jgi:hypothetical protein
MLRKRKGHLFFVVGIIFLIISLAIPLINANIINSSNNNEEINNDLLYFYDNFLHSNSNSNPKSSISLEGVEKIKITDLSRTINMEGNGLLTIQDQLTLKNNNNFSISYILVGFTSNNSENLIYTRASEGFIPLSVEKTDFLLQENILTMKISLFSPLKANQTKIIRLTQCFKDRISFESVGTVNNPDEQLSFTGYVFPLLPYEIEGNIYTKMNLPEGLHDVLDIDWGARIPGTNSIEYKWTEGTLDPFLENMGTQKTIQVVLKDKSTTNIEISQLFRTITISPWGVLKVKENYYIKNNGSIPVNQFELNLPEAAVNLKIYDFLGDLDLGETEVTQQGDISGIQITPNPFVPGFQKLTFQISRYRGNIDPGATYQFSLEYQFDPNDYTSFSWFKQSIQMYLYPSYFNYLGKNQLTQIIIDGASGIDSISTNPGGIINSQGEMTITYFEEYLVPIEIPFQILAFTYKLDIFKILSWPLLYTTTIACICAIFVIIIKKRKQGEIAPLIVEEELPTNEIRKFCSLYAEKHALMLEMTRAEQQLNDKKLPKKKYRIIKKRNQSKIKSIEQEIKPFKETLKETNEVFENIINTIELLETERNTIEDGLKLLKARYKRGKIPSRSAYASLSNDFNKRLNKVEKSIDKSIQQLRSYIL